MRKGITILILATLAGRSYAQTFDWRKFIFWDRGKSSGLVRPGWTGWDLRTTNLLKWSEDFSNAAWAKVNTAVSGEEVTTTNSNHLLTQSVTVIPSAIYTFSFMAKLGTLATPKYSIYDSTNGANITAPTSYASLINASTYTRVSFTFTVPSTCTSVAVYPVRDSSGTGTVYVKEAQLNEGSTALPYVATTDLQRVAVGPDLRGAIPIRREIGGVVSYSPAPDTASKYTYSNGEVRQVTGTNLLTHSEALDNAAWTKTGATLTANYGIAPDGTKTSIRGVFSGSDKDVVQMVTSAVPCVFSIWVKGVNGETIQLALSGGNNTVLTLNGAWQQLTHTGASTTLVAIGTWLGATVRDIEIWHPQLNPGTLPDTYTKTEGVALEPGYPFLTLGASTAAGSDDPVRRASGMVFDGSNDYLTTTLLANPPVNTVIAVANPAAINGYYAVAGTDSAGTPPAFTLYANLAGSGNNLPSYVQNRANGSQSIGAGAAQLTVGQFADLVGVGRGDSTDLHINAALQSTRGSGVTAWNTRLELVVGAGFYQNNKSDFFTGTISHVDLYNRALNPREIRQNHNYLRALMAQTATQLNPFSTDFSSAFGSGGYSPLP